MAQRRTPTHPYLVVEAHQRLVAVPAELDGREVTYYFVEDELANGMVVPAIVRDALIASGDWDDLVTSNALTHVHASTQDALNVIGAWADLDSDDMEARLDRIRHEGIPTSPIEP